LSADQLPVIMMFGSTLNPPNGQKYGYC